MAAVEAACRAEDLAEGAPRPQLLQADRSPAGDAEQQDQDQEDPDDDPDRRRPPSGTRRHIIEPNVVIRSI